MFFYFFYVNLSCGCPILFEQSTLFGADGEEILAGTNLAKQLLAQKIMPDIIENSDIIILAQYQSNKSIKKVDLLKSHDISPYDLDTRLSKFKEFGRLSESEFNALFPPSLLEHLSLEELDYSEVIEKICKTYKGSRNVVKRINTKYQSSPNDYSDPKWESLPRVIDQLKKKSKNQIGILDLDQDLISDPKKTDRFEPNIIEHIRTIQISRQIDSKFNPGKTVKSH